VAILVEARIGRDSFPEAFEALEIVLEVLSRIRVTQAL
jgi:hypothetical protein